MPRRYPMTRGEFAGAPPNPVECCACASRATGQVRVAWDYMRGNDDWMPVCSRHLKMAKKKENRFVAHMLTKDRHLRRND